MVTTSFTSTEADNTRLESTYLSVTTPMEEFSIMDVFKSKPPLFKKKKAVQPSGLGAKKSRMTLPGGWRSPWTCGSFMEPATSQGLQSSMGFQGSRAGSAICAQKAGQLTQGML